MLGKLFFSGFILILLVTDIIRIKGREPARSEWYSLIWFAVTLIIAWAKIKPETLISSTTMIVILIAFLVTGIHFVFTVLNYWFIYDRFEKQRLFPILGYGGVTVVFLINGYMVLNL